MRGDIGPLGGPDPLGLFAL